MMRKIKLTNQPRWTTVFLTKDEATIRIYKLKLETEEIPVMIFDQRDSSYNAFGDMYLQVPVEFEERAKALIEA
jgi:hypothetical protein